MKIKDLINSDLKTALLSQNKEKTSILRGMKSAILDAEIAQNKRDTGLTEEEVSQILAKEAKKRKESAEIYAKVNEHERAAAENSEADIIKQYLPEQMSDVELEKLINHVIAEIDDASMQQMGIIIGKVKKQAGVSADGALIARIVKEKLGK